MATRLGNGPKHDVETFADSLGSGGDGGFHGFGSGRSHDRNGCQPFLWLGRGLTEPQ
ncbi:MAG TPA: hypothetical protein VK541_06625 [Pedobacter sp.]|nr:hypothetical protein [Pedobacter sp.]HMI02136.1 hypothetical protein [Pedobacter sp.]